LALVAGWFGFGGIALAPAGIAKTLFSVFIVFAIIALVIDIFTGKRLAP